MTVEEAAKPEPTIEPLDPNRHDRASFSCGKAPLDRFLREQADQERRRDISQTYVLAKGREIPGYYTLSATSVDLSLVPPNIGEKLPRYPVVPAILLGRLAVDARFARQGLGERLVVDALRVAVEISRKAGAAFVIVDAMDENAAAFYAHMGFRPFESQPLKLFLRMADAAAALGQPRSP